MPYKEDDGVEVEACNVFFVWEMLRPLLRGQTLLVISDDVIYDPPALIEYLSSTGTTRMLYTPSLLEAVLDSKYVSDLGEGPIEALKKLKTIFLCGEVVTVSLQERCKEKLPWASLWNLYSVSECHDVACVNLAGSSFKGRKYCPVGTVFDNVEATVMDENLKELPVGEVGELYVAGPVLARGYLNLAELTAKRFPTIGGKRFYKSGDNAKLLPNRELEILGRCDSMQKIRGYSVELRAVEAAIVAMDEVRLALSSFRARREKTSLLSPTWYWIMEARGKYGLRLKASPHGALYLVKLDELPTHQVSGKLDKVAPKVDVSAKGRSRTCSTRLTARPRATKMRRIFMTFLRNDGNAAGGRDSRLIL